MSKFKIGDTIHYMESNKAQQKEIKGISRYEGKVELSSLKIDAAEGKTVTKYHTGFFESVDEENAYATKEELQQSVFNN